MKAGLEFLEVWKRVFGSRWPLPRTIEVGPVEFISYTDRDGAEVFGSGPLGRGFS